MYTNPVQVEQWQFKGDFMWENGEVSCANKSSAFHPEDESGAILWNSRNYLPKDITSHHITSHHSMDGIH
jgi:hypothetical protein